MERRFRRGLFIGRFQPFHKGHLHAAKFALRVCKNLIIGIGSSQESGTIKNPLQSKARRKIIRSALSAEGIDMKRISFLEIPDFNDNEEWFKYIAKRARVDVVFSRHRLVRKIFNDRGVRVISPPWFERRRMSATEVRKRIGKNGRWERLVPRGAVKEIRARLP